MTTEELQELLNTCVVTLQVMPHLFASTKTMAVLKKLYPAHWCYNGRGYTQGKDKDFFEANTVLEVWDSDLEKGVWEGNDFLVTGSVENRSNIPLRLTFYKYSIYIPKNTDF